MSREPRPVTNPAGNRPTEGPIRFKNETGGALTRGTLVYISGIDAGSRLPNVAKADNDAAGKEAQWVVLTASVANNGVGVVGKRCRLTGQNTNAASAAEDPVYLSATAGGWTVTAPTGADTIVQIVGWVEVKSATVGVVELRIPYSPKAIGTNEIADAAVTAAKLAAAVAGNGLTGGAGTALAVGVDDSTIEINTDALRIKDLGVGTAKIAANAVTSAKLDENLRQRAVVQLTNAQVLAVRATPITLVAAPGANKAIVVEEVHMVCDAAAGAYTETADNLAIEYSGGTDILTVETTGFLDQAAVGARWARPAIALTTPVANEAVQISNNGDGEFGGGNAANTLSVEVIYRVVDTVAFSS